MNAPASFQEMTNTIFNDIEGYVWYLDDILICERETEEEHQALVEKVLEKYVEYELAVNLPKSEFHVEQILFLGHIINGQQVQIDPAKLEVMAKWPVAIKKNKVQAFLGFANYYRQFIVNYSSKPRLLIKLTKDIPFSWTSEQQAAFDELCQQFMSSPILTQFDRSLDTIIETDASNQAISGILSQYHVTNSIKRLHPVAYHAKTLTATQRNWPIYNKKLFKIVDSFWKWRDWLVGVHVNVYTDYQDLQYFNTKQKLNSHQVSWYLYMSEFFYTIHYKPASKIGKADGLSTCSGKEKSSMEAWFFDEGQLLVNGEDEELDAKDVELAGIDVSTWERKDGLWVVPPEFRTDVLRQHHDNEVAGHWGRYWTQELVSRNFIWDG